ncbi:BZ3500_MvSof-1268-A1-R1_Chr9g10553 [Microbotryum saponariae]|uniref:BZ3500_MvSof-1268-A1-R1_Chr9g10553 protein n=1 Tax=Microbotryum saponariae TaxID=289078 RepID=A0A2X0N694_9BASI|nr:BZ3501_MvSof-1269-A2-R1_Chr9g10302 [Microbotryum saponariae]SDA00287.1 BZ3500_MvSof-1268-A1-R1_Chr9g10553 [Microbotryum saponariae]
MLLLNLLSAVVLAAPTFAAALPSTFLGHAFSSGAQPYTLDKRELQRQAAVRIALAKSRAKRSARRNAGGLSELAEDDLARRNIEEAYSALGVHRRSFETSASTLSKRRLPRMRCFPNRVGGQANADEFCRAFYVGKVAYPSIATASCDQVCTISCPSGYTQQSNDRNVFCIRNVDQCNNVTCPQDPNGLSGCSNGACTLTCLTRGYTKSRSGTSCLSFGSDPNNCGREGVVCPRSYNGFFPPGCSNGQCSLTCPRGSSPGTVNNQPTCV